MQRRTNTYLLLAQDNGLAELLPRATSLLESGGRLVLLANCSDSKSVADLDIWYGLKNQHLSRCVLMFVLRDEAQLLPQLEGDLSREHLQALQPALLSWAGIEQVLLAGGDAWVAQRQAELLQLGIAQERIQRVGSGGEQAVAPAARLTGDVQVSVTAQGRMRQFGMSKDGTVLLDAAEEAGLELPYSCRGGICSTCRTRVVQGEVEMLDNAALDDWEVEAGYVLTCQAVPLSDTLHLDYDDV